MSSKAQPASDPVKASDAALPADRPPTAPVDTSPSDGGANETASDQAAPEARVVQSEVDAPAYTAEELHSMLFGFMRERPDDPASISNQVLSEVDEDFLFRFEQFELQARAIGKVPTQGMGVDELKRLRELLATAREIWWIVEGAGEPETFNGFVDQVRGLVQKLHAFCALPFVPRHLRFNLDLLKPHQVEESETRWERLIDLVSLQVLEAANDTTGKAVTLGSAAKSLGVPKDNISRLCRTNWTYFVAKYRVSRTEAKKAIVEEVWMDRVKRAIRPSSHKGTRQGLTQDQLRRKDKIDKKKQTGQRPANAKSSAKGAIRPSPPKKSRNGLQPARSRGKTKTVAMKKP